MATTAVQKGGAASALYDILDLILDKGLVVDVFAGVSLVGIELLTVDVRVVIASVDTYLRFAEACNRLDLNAGRGAPLLGAVGGVTEALRPLADAGEGAGKGATGSSAGARGDRAAATGDLAGVAPGRGSDAPAPEPATFNRAPGPARSSAPTPAMQPLAQPVIAPAAEPPPPAGPRPPAEPQAPAKPPAEGGPTPCFESGESSSVMPTARIASGKTTPGKGWVADPEHKDHIYIDVDSSAAGFITVPVYLCSLSGTEWHCYTLGGNSVYSPTERGFRVYLTWARGVANVNRWNVSNLIGRSNDRGWHVKWIGIERAAPLDKQASP